MKIILINSPISMDFESKKYSIGDDSLSDSGLIRARELGEELKSKKTLKIFYSSFQSAVETVLIIKKIFPIQTIIVSDFRGRNEFGVLLGLSKEEVKNNFFEELKDYESNNPFHHTMGVEDYFDFAKRVTVSFNSIIKNEFENNSSCICFIVHSSVIEVIFRELIGFEIGKVKEGALIEVEFDEDGFEIISLKGVGEVKSTLS